MKLKYIVFIFLMIPYMASAEQEESYIHSGKYGITAFATSESGSIGLLFHLTGSFALKPSFSVYQIDAADQRYAGSLEFDYYKAVSRDFSVYTGISFGSSYNKYNYKYSDGDISKSKKIQYSGSVVIGAQYMFNNRFGFFADTGFQYTRQNSDYSEYDASSGSTSGSDTWNNIYATKSANIGAVFYFTE